MVLLVDGPFAGDRVVVDPHAIARDRGLTFVVRGEQRELMGTLVTSLDGSDDPAAAARRLTREWRAVHYRTAGVMKLEFAGHHALVASGGDRAGLRRGVRLDGGGPSTWSVWVSELDEPARRFAAVAALFPPGPMADAVLELHGEVVARLAEAERLAQVGAAAYPRWRPGDVDPRAEAVAAAIDALHEGLFRALDSLVDLHLAVRTGAAPEIPRLETLLEAWRDLHRGGAFGP